MELEPDAAKTIDKVISADQDWRGRNSDMEPERKEMGTVRQKPVVSVCIACEYRHDRSLRGIEQPCWTKRLVLGTVFKEWRWRQESRLGLMRFETQV